MITRFEFEAIGTHWSIDLDFEQNRLDDLKSAIMHRIADFDMTYSRFRPDSVVSAIAQRAGTYLFPSDAEKLFSMYRAVYDATGGAVTPFIGSVLSGAGYDKEYSFIERDITEAPVWDDVAVWDGRQLETNIPLLLDFGAGGKGYLVDIVSGIIESCGVTSYCVNAGGDMRYRSDSGAVLKVGLENPFNHTEVIGVVDVVQGSLCGSSGSRRKWSHFHHIIHPHKLTSPQEIVAVWVTAQDTIVADLLTTALFFVPPEVLLPSFDFKYVIMQKDSTVSYSPDISAEFFG
jgi:thiamine biosynthesis lipoprotein